MANMDFYSALANAQFQHRCEGGILKAAPYVLIEDPGAPNHTVRRAVAVRVMQSGVNWGEWVRWIVTDGTINPKIADLSTVTDAEIDTVVGAAWAWVGGVLPGD